MDRGTDTKTFFLVFFHIAIFGLITQGIQVAGEYKLFADPKTSPPEQNTSIHSLYLMLQKSKTHWCFFATSRRAALLLSCGGLITSMNDGRVNGGSPPPLPCPPLSLSNSPSLSLQP